MHRIANRVIVTLTTTPTVPSARRSTSSSKPQGRCYCAEGVRRAVHHRRQDERKRAASSHPGSIDTRPLSFPALVTSTLAVHLRECPCRANPRRPCYMHTRFVVASREEDTLPVRRATVAPRAPQAAYGLSSSRFLLAGRLRTPACAVEPSPSPPLRPRI
ncbi:hypothetical protein C8T65DRAFT_670821 [Cerioporus squamosus]|nr:hypothetical protein C8T65DRAFT_670821 [Cerioporus squamosus]